MQGSPDDGSVGNAGKRVEGFFIEYKPDEDGEVSGRINKDRVEPVLLAIRPGGIGHDMPEAGAHPVHLDYSLPVDGDLPPRVEDHAFRAVGDLEDLLSTHWPYLFYLMQYINVITSVIQVNRAH